MQGNMVISCSSVFYPQTFCLAGMVFLPPSKQETKSLSSNLLPASSPTSIRPRVLRARQRSWHGQLWAQSSGTCPDQAPREVEEEMPAQAAQLALCWFNPLAIWSLLPAMHAACSGKWKLSAGFSLFFFSSHFCKPGCMKRVENPGWHAVLCCLSAQRNRCTENQRCHLARIQLSLHVVKIIAIQICGDCWVWVQIERITENPT